MSIKITPEFRAGSLSFRAGIIVLVAVVVGLFISFKAQTGLPFAPTTTVSAYFDNVGTLKANDTVRENSKIVGRVSKVQYVDGRALVTFSLNGHANVYANATAQIWDLSALATKFIELDPGTSQAGPISAPIQTSHTKNSADLYQVLNVLDPTTRAAATTLIQQVGSGFAGHGADLSDFLRVSPNDLADLSKVSKALSTSPADLAGMLASAKALSARFNGSEQTISDLMDQSASTLEVVGVDNGAPLGSTIEELPSTLANLNTAMTKLKQPLADARLAMVALDPGAQALGKATPDLRGFLTAAVPVLGQVPAVAQDAMPALASLSTTMTDARPLAPRIESGLAYAMTPLEVLAPYTTDFSQLWFRGRSFVSQGPRPGLRYARLGVSPGVNTITGGLLSSGQALPQNNYPAPGVAQNDRATGLLPVGVPK